MVPWVRRAEASCLDSAGRATVRPSVRLTAGVQWGRRAAEGHTEVILQKTTPLDGGAGAPPCPGPQFAFSLRPSPPLSPPLRCLLFYITHFYSPSFPALCVSPPEQCGGAARPDSFDLRAVHVVEIRGPAALPSRRSRNGALPRENRPLFSAALFLEGHRGGEVEALQLAESVLAGGMSAGVKGETYRLVVCPSSYGGGGGKSTSSVFRLGPSDYMLLEHLSRKPDCSVTVSYCS